MTKPLVPWSQEQFDAFGSRPLVARHRLHELDLFTDDALIDVLDGYPRKYLQVFTMGTDPCHPEEWQMLNSEGLSGKSLYTALLRGRFWFNLRRVESADPRFRGLIEGLYDEIAAHCPHFRHLSSTGALLISSPGAMVYYHLDAPGNLLWHIRGRKRVWIYPAFDDRFAPQELVEDICAGFVDDNLPYSPDFDRQASVFDPEPGEVLSWPQTAPHRVQNLSTVNVSLSTYYVTPETERLRLTHAANRLFRRKCGLPMRSLKQTGLPAASKRLLYRVCRRAGLDGRERSPDYTITARVDPDAPNAIAPLDAASPSLRA